MNPEIISKSMGTSTHSNTTQITLPRTNIKICRHQTYPNELSHFMSFHLFSVDHPLVIASTKNYNNYAITVLDSELQ